MFNVRHSRLAVVLAATALAISVPTAAFAECWGGGGGEGGAKMDIEPAGATWSGWYSIGFKIKNVGSTTWTIAGFVTASGSYGIADPSGCYNKSIAPGGSCTIQITGKSEYKQSFLEAWATSGGKVVASDTSLLNSGH